MTRRVYATQYGVIWSFSLQEWLAFVEKTITNDGEYDLDKGGRQVATRPVALFRSARLGFESTRSDVRCVRPLDWSMEDWIDERKEMLEELKQIRLKRRCTACKTKIHAIYNVATSGLLCPECGAWITTKLSETEKKRWRRN